MIPEYFPWRGFLRSAAALLVIAAAAKLYSAAGSARILTVPDPLVHLTYRTLMIGLGALETAIAAYLVCGRHTLAKLWLVFWLSSNFLMYRCASAHLHIHMCPCLGTIAAALPLRKGEVDFLLLVFAACLFFGSAFLLAVTSREHRGAAQSCGMTKALSEEHELRSHDEADTTAGSHAPQNPSAFS
jgi:hypothetical protein